MNHFKYPGKNRIISNFQVKTSICERCHNRFQKQGVSTAGNREVNAVDATNCAKNPKAGFARHLWNQSKYGFHEHYVDPKSEDRIRFKYIQYKPLQLK